MVVRWSLFHVQLYTLVSMFVYLFLSVLSLEASIRSSNNSWYRNFWLLLAIVFSYENSYSSSNLRLRHLYYFCFGFWFKFKFRFFFFCLWPHLHFIRLWKSKNNHTILKMVFKITRLFLSIRFKQNIDTRNTQTHTLNSLIFNRKNIFSATWTHHRIITIEHKVHMVWLSTKMHGIQMCSILASS